MNHFLTIALFALFIQNAYPQGSACFDIPVAGLYLANPMISGNNSDLFVSSGNGLFLTADDCKTWTQLSKGDSVCPWLNGLVVTKQNHIIGNFVFEKNIYRTTNMGKDWQKLPIANFFFSFAGDTTGTLWAVSDNGIYKSKDEGTSWGKVCINESFYSQVCVSKQNDVYALAGEKIYVDEMKESNYSKILLKRG